MRVWSLQGGRVMVTKIGSVNTPRNVDVASTTKTLCEASAERLRLKLHGCEALGQSTVSELRGRIHGGDFAGVSRKRMSFAVFLSSPSIGRPVHDCHARRRCEETSRNNHPVDASRRMSDAF